MTPDEEIEHRINVALYIAERLADVVERLAPLKSVSRLNKEAMARACDDALWARGAGHVRKMDGYIVGQRLKAAAAVCRGEKPSAEVKS